MFGFIVSLFVRKKFADTFEYERVEHNGGVYHVREFNLEEGAQYIEAMSGLAESGDAGEDVAVRSLYVSGWIVSVCCKEFSGVKPHKISGMVAPSLIQKIVEKAVVLSGMSESARDEIEKKS